MTCYLGHHMVLQVNVKILLCDKLLPTVRLPKMNQLRKGQHSHEAAPADKVLHSF